MARSSSIRGAIIFFVDGNNSKTKATNLNEIPLTAGIYAASPTVVESYTNAAGYGNGISGLAIAGNGTLYFSVNGDGIFAIPNTQSGGPAPSGFIRFPRKAERALRSIPKATSMEFPITAAMLSLSSRLAKRRWAPLPRAPPQLQSAPPIFDSAASCTTLRHWRFPSLSLAYPRANSPQLPAPLAPRYSAEANGVFASGPLTAAAFASFPVTVDFTPTAIGERSAALSITDSANSASGTAALSGVGQGPTGNVDPGVATAYTTGFTDPTDVVADPAGDVFVADPGAGAVSEFAHGSTTPVAVGSGFINPDGVAFDANGNLFIADDGVPEVVEIPNTGTAGAFVAGTQKIVISSSTLFGGTALANATALAVGPNGTLYISDNGKQASRFLEPDHRSVRCHSCHRGKRPQIFMGNCR